MAALKLCVRVCEQHDPARTRRGTRHMRVMTPASSGSVLISASNPAPHRAAVFVYLAAHGAHIGPVQLFERTENPKLDAAGLGPVWHFVADLEIPHA